jgi:hypothetical protein
VHFAVKLTNAVLTLAETLGLLVVPVPKQGAVEPHCPEFALIAAVRLLAVSAVVLPIRTSLDAERLETKVYTCVPAGPVMVSWALESGLLPVQSTFPPVGRVPFVVRFTPLIVTPWPVPIQILPLKLPEPVATPSVKVAVVPLTVTPAVPPVKLPEKVPVTWAAVAPFVSSITVLVLL